MSDLHEIFFSTHGPLTWWRGGMRDGEAVVQISSDGEEWIDAEGTTRALAGEAELATLRADLQRAQEEIEAERLERSLASDERDQQRERAERLAKALVNTADHLLPDGSPCWCSAPLTGGDHRDWCIESRAALRGNERGDEAKAGDVNADLPSFPHGTPVACWSEGGVHFIRDDQGRTWSAQYTSGGAPTEWRREDDNERDEGDE